VAELYIGGKWTGTRDGGRREIRCPADGSLVAEVDEATAPDASAAVVAIQPLHRAVRVDWPEVGVRQPCEQPLRLAQRVAEQHGGATVVAVGTPPRTDLVENRPVRRPSIDWKPERALGDERVASQELERRARGVRLDLVVARRDPYLPAMFDAYLGGAENVAGGVEGDADAADVDGLSPVYGADRSTHSEPRAKDRFPLARAEVPMGSPPSVVAVAVRDDGALDGLPRIDVKIPGLAIQAPLGQSKQRHERR